ncbi:hypothetical protein Tco_0791134 [Tanacetum coccineum]
MKEIFEELEAEVDQHVVDRKYDKIERKNILIANDNLIADCLFKDVFLVATNSELNVSSFTEIHDAHTSLKARCLELEVELFDLRDKIQKDNHDELIKQFSNLEVTRAKWNEYIQEKDKKKAKNKQNQSQARDGKDKVNPKPKSVKVKSQPMKSNTTEGPKTAKTQLYYYRKRTWVEIAILGRVLQ